MNYYEIAILARALDNLTYHFEDDLEVGTEVLVSIKNKGNLKAVVIAKTQLAPSFKTIPITAVLHTYYSTFMMEVAKFICDYYVCYFAQAIALFNPYQRVDKPNEITASNITDNIELSIMQQHALEFISNNKISLLFADTGSGKTEIYIKQMIKMGEKNKQSLLLMPEISLTPQMEKRLKSIFGNQVAIWHSKVSKKKKDEILKGVQENKIKIIAGARSALFLPFASLGLIVVDEEHDESYKADSSPRINVKDLAIYIGSKYDIQVILGSATPSCTSYHKIKHFRLKETFFETTKEFIYDEVPLGVSDLLVNKLRQTILSNKQAIVFLPTRANFRYQVCDTCGKAIECPFCSVSMSLHKNQKALKCHYCGYACAIPERCPHCANGIIKNFRIGTAEVESLLQEKFINHSVVKFDRDAIKTEKELKHILSEFNDGHISILVGTQMLSKGHDYHNVTLAAILGIDSVLSMNSYRSREKAVSLLVQLSGRSGRNGFGNVFIQTSNKDFFEYYLSKFDYEKFLQDELVDRAKLYPPFVRIAKVYFSHQNFEIAKKEMEEAVSILKNEPIDVVGFGESFVFKVANKYRYEIFVRSVSVNKLLNALHKVKNIGSVDMDCIS